MGMVTTPNIPGGSFARFLRHQSISNDDLAKPWAKFQKWVTGQSYEEVWELSTGRTVQLDAIENGYVVEAKWLGANDVNFASSPYSPNSGFYNEARIIDQVSRQIQFANEQGLNGVRWSVSNEAGRKYFANLFETYFPKESESNFLQVWHVPGNGMSN